MYAMKPYSYDDTDRPFFAAAWDILVSEARASNDPYDKESFILAFTQIDYPATEYRFQGVLGFGGKFWRNDGRFYVSCYPEDRTKQTERVIESVNNKLLVLQAEMSPNPYSPVRR